MAAPSASPHRVFIAAHLALGARYCVDILGGMDDYCRLHGLPWTILPMNVSHSLASRKLKAMQVAGAVVQLFRSQTLEVVQELGLPAVNVSNASPTRNAPLPSVVTDDRRVGEMAAQHYLEKGFTHFSYLGPRHNRTAELREQGMRARLTQRGFRLTTRHHDLPLDYNNGCLEAYYAQPESLDDVVRWLRRLPAPHALFCFSDIEAHLLRVVCEREGLAVPERISLLGVNNEFSNQLGRRVEVSSIALNGQEVGSRAAALLHRLLGGGADDLDTGQASVAPLRVMEGHSTDTFGVGDPVVRQALQLIDRRFVEGLRVQELARLCGLSSRSLELKFLQALGTSPREILLGRRVGRAKQLLLETDFKLEEIARLSGFTDGRHLSLLFTNKTGMNPSVFRTSGSPRAPRRGGHRRFLASRGR